MPECCPSRPEALQLFCREFCSRPPRASCSSRSSSLPRSLAPWSRPFTWRRTRTRWRACGRLPSVCWQRGCDRSNDHGATLLFLRLPPSSASALLRFCASAQLQNADSSKLVRDLKDTGLRKALEQEGHAYVSGTARFPSLARQPDVAVAAGMLRQSCSLSARAPCAGGFFCLPHRKLLGLLSGTLQCDTQSLGWLEVL